ncbi:aminoglycoside 6-adenylyltransferase [Olivibacter sp. CPCC 100613]|uniref:aminoglycoside 6-adenylyltransferase n=1 Tax=Olivibacter sp. CPCC 100613 TaxID=3079931 RepID=UPI002FF63242
MHSRTEAQMMKLILEVAEKDSRILAVLQDGSRSNPNVTKDIFQDYDIIYVVEDLEPFLENPDWVDVFGELMISQMPEDMELYPPSPELAGAFSYLLQLKDGNRIDLMMVPLKILDHFTSDSLCKVIWDKGHLFRHQPLPPASDASYIVKKPSARSFQDCCNEFWYTAAGLAKGLWRGELILVKELFNQVIHGALMQMMDWYIGCRHEFAVNPGKFGKFYQRYLEPETYERFLTTYSDATMKSTWQAVYVSIELFRDSAIYVSTQLGYTYNAAWDKNVTEYILHVQQLPKSAERIYTEI